MSQLLNKFKVGDIVRVIADTIALESAGCSRELVKSGNTYQIEEVDSVCARIGPKNECCWVNLDKIEKA